MKPKFTQQFDNRTFPGESISTVAGHWRFTATLIFDADTRPDDSDGYSVEDKKRWNHDRWFFAGIEIRVEYHGVTLSDSVSLWGLEVNLSADNAHLTETANELIGEAERDAKATLEKLRS